MGKDSLIKSTSKKKAKKDEDTVKAAAKKKTTKKTTAKKSTKTVTEPKKTTAKKKSTAKVTPKKKKTAAKPKTKAATKPKAKSTAKPKTKKAAKPKPKAAPKKPTVKELLRKSFAPISKPAKPLSVTTPKIKTPSAPPFVSVSDPKEAERIRGLLFQTYNMADIKAAAKPPVAKEPVAQPSPGAEPEKTEAVQEVPKEETPDSGPQSVEPPTIITDIPTEAAPDPVSKTVKMIAAGIGAVILLVMMISYNNSQKYYIEPKDNAIEIWKGQFSPKDKQYYMVLHGKQFNGEIKETYSKADVFPLICSYFLDKADTLLEVPGLPDFDGIKSYLYNAKKYAINDNMGKGVNNRLNNIERMILLYKADVAISKGSLDSLKNAEKLLKSAQKLTTNTAQEQEIQQKLSLAAGLKAALQKGK